MSDSRFHIVVYGATSFVGQILAQYLYDRHGENGDLKWAMAGRSESKLKQVREQIGASALPLVVADASDEAALRSMCDSADVIISTVGPYALYGSTLVKICAETGTDYCDLTGEVQWIRRMIAEHEKTAQKSGARIVHCCGFDSIPSDLGVHFLQREARERFGKPCTRVKTRVKAMRGGMSGGTVASLMNVMKEVKSNPALRKELANPYSLCVDRPTAGMRQPNVKFAEYDKDAKSWLAPFIMAGINTRIVHRTNALTGNGYGGELVYDEAMMMGDGIKGSATAAAFSSAMGAFLAGAVIPPTRVLLEKFVVPKPGEGPSPKEQKEGFWDYRIIGISGDGQKITAKVTGDRDPGYGSTAKMLGEAGVCLASDISKSTVKGGFWTPASIFGDKLIERMTAHAGLTFEILG